MMWSTTQAVVAMSSGEAELYALTKGAANSLGVISLLSYFVITLDAQVKSDASAAIGVVNRTGVGNLRHVRVQYLWLQNQVRNGELAVQKIPGVSNPADLLTKHLDFETMKAHLDRLGFQLRLDRAASAPALHWIHRGDYLEEGEGVQPKDRLKDQSKDDWQEDAWEVTEEQATRWHNRARFELFTPLRVRGAPPARCLTNARITEGVYVASGKTFKVVDSWTSRQKAHASLRQAWTGKTTFIART